MLEGFTTFSSISDEKVLMEVINHDKGINYMTRMHNKILYYLKIKLLNYSDLNVLELNLISQICQRILKNCYCPSLEDRLNNVLSKLEAYLNNCTFKPTNTIEVNSIIHTLIENKF